MTPAYDHYGYSVVERSNRHYLVTGEMVSGAQEHFMLIFGVDHWLLNPWGWWVGDSGENAVAHSMVRMPDDGVAIVGTADGKLVVSRRDANLNPLWQKMLNTSSERWSVIRAFDEDLIATGRVAAEAEALLAQFTSTGSCMWTDIGGSGTDVGYAVVEGSEADHPLWVGGTTWSWAVGLNDALVAKFDASLHTCCWQSFTPGCGNWSPPEDSHAMSQSLPLDYVVWTWLPQLINDPAALTLTVVCDDECEDACCLDDHTCLDLTPYHCESQDGTPQGSGTTCAPIGACCLSDGACVETSEECCALAEGAFQGGGTPCLQPQACCLADGTCLETDPGCCGTLRGEVRVGHCQGDDNNNGIDDACESCPNPGKPAPRDWYCTADIAGTGGQDCVVGLADLATLLEHYGCASCTHLQGDVEPEDHDGRWEATDGDGDVDTSDLAQLLSQYTDNCN